MTNAADDLKHCVTSYIGGDALYVVKKAHPDWEVTALVSLIIHSKHVPFLPGGIFGPNQDRAALQWSENLKKKETRVL